MGFHGCESNLFQADPPNCGGPRRVPVSDKITLPIKSPTTKQVLLIVSLSTMAVILMIVLAVHTRRADAEEACVKLIAQVVEAEPHRRAGAPFREFERRFNEQEKVLDRAERACADAKRPDKVLEVRDSRVSLEGIWTEEGGGLRRK